MIVFGLGVSKDLAGIVFGETTGDGSLYSSSLISAVESKAEVFSSGSIGSVSDIVEDDKSKMLMTAPSWFVVADGLLFNDFSAGWVAERMHCFKSTIFAFGGEIVDIDFFIDSNSSCILRFCVYRCFIALENICCCCARKAFIYGGHSMIVSGFGD